MLSGVFRLHVSMEYTRGLHSNNYADLTVKKASFQRSALEALNPLLNM